MSGADFKIGTISSSKTSAKGSSRRQPRGAFFCEDGRCLTLIVAQQKSLSEGQGR